MCGHKFQIGSGWLFGIPYNLYILFYIFLYILNNFPFGWWIILVFRFVARHKFMRFIHKKRKKLSIRNDQNRRIHQAIASICGTITYHPINITTKTAICLAKKIHYQCTWKVSVRYSFNFHTKRRNGKRNVCERLRKIASALNKYACAKSRWRRCLYRAATETNEQVRYIFRSNRKRQW